MSEKFSGGTKFFNKQTNKQTNKRTKKKLVLFLVCSLETLMSILLDTKLRVDVVTCQRFFSRFIMYVKLGDRKFEPIEHTNKKEGRKRAANTALLELQREGKIPRPVRLEDKIPRPVKLSV